jgi:hypothetical protein
MVNSDADALDTDGVLPGGVRHFARMKIISYLTISSEIAKTLGDCALLCAFLDSKF